MTRYAAMRIHINLRVVLPTAPYFIFHIGSIPSHRHAVKRTQLVAAAKNGRMTDVARLIKCGANMEAKDASVRVCRDALTCFFIFELRSGASVDRFDISCITWIEQFCMLPLM